jgi:hypothetical protein
MISSITSSAPSCAWATEVNPGATRTTAEIGNRYLKNLDSLNISFLPHARKMLGIVAPPIVQAAIDPR